jgi:protoheme IX farnesyltransferase
MSDATTIPAQPLALGPVASMRRWPAVYFELAKARLSMLVLITTGVGYLLGCGDRIDWPLLGWLMLGTALCAACANAFNQLMEIERDSRMPRTHHRPLPSGRIGAMHTAVMATLAGGAGATMLAAKINAMTAGLALLTILLYLLLYTPLKTRTTHNTLVGAVVGAIPPMMGWTAARGRVEAGAWALAATLFVWQIPHFLALAWMYRRDYALGGYRMLPIIDPSGVVTCRAVLMWSVALLPVTLAVSFVGLSGWLYAASAVALGLWMIKLGVDLHRRRDELHARKLFIASVIYLPLLMAMMVLDRLTHQN